jgi:hypothetical protein
MSAPSAPPGAPYSRPPVIALAMSFASLMFFIAAVSIVGLSTRPQRVVQQARVVAVAYAPVVHSPVVHSPYETMLYNHMRAHFPAMSAEEHWRMVRNYERCCPPPPCCPRRVVAMHHAAPTPRPPLWPLAFAGLLGAAAIGTSLVTRRRTLPMHP